MYVDPRQKEPVNCTSVSSGTFWCLELGDLFSVFGKEDGHTVSYDLRMQRQLFSVEGHSSYVRCLRIEGSSLLTGGGDSKMLLREATR
jgi:hypothetical protein